MVQPSRLDDARDAVEAQIELRDTVWRPAIEKFANANRGKLRLDPKRTARVTGLYGPISATAPAISSRARSSPWFRTAAINPTAV